MPIDENGRSSYDNAKETQVTLARCKMCRLFMWTTPLNRPYCKECLGKLNSPFRLNGKPRKSQSPTAKSK